ncbi:MAG: hypothetical protein ACTS2F_23935 [Thainema sp.]
MSYIQPKAAFYTIKARSHLHHTDIVRFIFTLVRFPTLKILQSRT